MSSLVPTDLAREVLEANLVIPREGLATLTWGNVSGVDRDRGIYLIKPSGIPYDRLRLEHMVPVDLDTGQVIHGDLKPSTDSETHRLLYLQHPSIGGVTHTHSKFASAFAQAHRPIPMLGTTHADTFNGDVPLTRSLTAEECAQDYEFNTGRAILETIADGTSPMTVPGALAAGHGPFTWGENARKSVEVAVVCEAVAEMALLTIALQPGAESPGHLFERHFTRKHGPSAYYGNPSAIL